MKWIDSLPRGTSVHFSDLTVQKTLQVADSGEYQSLLFPRTCLRVATFFVDRLGAWKDHR
eukprot:5754540-Prorocentrum_lima.AAC.1